MKPAAECRDAHYICGVQYKSCRFATRDGRSGLRLHSFAATFLPMQVLAKINAMYLLYFETLMSTTSSLE